MSADCIEKNGLKGNEDFVAFLHERARWEKIPATCDKRWLADFWKNNRGLLSHLFVMETGKVLFVPNDSDFFQQAAESYQG